jgi:hypothetical protein
LKFEHVKVVLGLRKINSLKSAWSSVDFYR